MIIKRPTFTPNYDHPMCNSLAGFWIASPGYGGYGSLKWFDICRLQNPGGLTGLIPSTAWSANSRPNGLGSISTIQSATEYIAVPRTTSLGVCTIAWWVYETSGNTFSYQFDCRVTSGVGYCFRTNSTGVLSKSAGTTYINGLADSVLPASQWTLVMISGITLSPSVQFQWFANSSHTAAQAHIGNLSEGLIWQRTFTASEAYQFYLESLQGYPSMLNRVRVPMVNVAAAGGGNPAAYFRMLQQMRLGA